MKIGIYSGTFNPIHLGHIILGSYIVDFTDINQVWYLVSPQNPLKEIDSSFQSEQTRLEMVKLSLLDYPNLVASDYEFNLQKPNYTWQTLASLKKDYPEHDFHLIIGADNCEQFYRWHNYQYILDNFPVFVFKRLGYRCENIVDSNKCLRLLDTPIIDISSTFVRKLIMEGKAYGPYLPFAVQEYIRENKLYI